ncbi:hypothetical protein [Ferrovibrio sp.]|uniref:hypothetical protein n=1 Tax=Ferrovibrio sp. TaxID=1917215 RepID=UPI003D109511
MNINSRSNIVAMIQEPYRRETLALLEAIDSGEANNQRRLAGRVGIAIGLLNALLRRAVQKGLVKVREAPARRYAYYLTPHGFSEKSRLVSEYLTDSLHFFRRARAEYTDCLQHMAALLPPGGRLFLVGSGELAEIAVLSANETGIALAGLLDARTNRQHFCGLPVLRDSDDLTPHDFILLSDAEQPQVSFDHWAERLGRQRIFAPPLLRIAQAMPVSESPEAEP